MPYPAAQFVAATPTSGQATQAGGNTNFSAVPYPNLGCIPYPNNTAQAGELITRVQLECTGYSCGFTEGDDSDVIQIRYYGRRPDAIAVNGQTPLCRNTTYPISVSSVFAATNYVWYTAGLNGAVISAVNGTNATLDLSGVPAGTNSITLRVAAQDNAHCGNIVSMVRELVVNIKPSPAASASMRLDGGVCPSTTAKFLAADPVTGASEYRWQLVGSNNPAGTYLVDTQGNRITTSGVTVKTAGFKLEIGAPTAGTVSVLVEAKINDCEGYSPALTKSFQIGNIAPNCPTTYTGPDRWCIGSPSTIYIVTQPGLSYYPINVFGAYAGNIQPAGAQVTSVTQTSAMAGSSEFTINMAPNSAGSYPTSFDLYVSVVSQCPGNTSGSQLCQLPVRVTNMVNCAVGGCVSCFPEEPMRAGGTSAAALYPNPATGDVKVELRPDTRYPWVKVVDAQGRVVLQRQSEAAAGVTGFDVKKLPTGLYQVQLFDGKKLTTQPLVKE